MVIITLVFVTLYALSIAGVEGLASDAAKELQPIVFVIIGYYFGRLPSQQVESALKVQADNQANNATAARNAERKAEVERGALEERINNARKILETKRAGTDAEAVKTDSTAIEAAIRVLSS